MYNTINWVLDYIYGWRKYNYYVGTIFNKYYSHVLFNGTWWNTINENIILGAIPLHNLNHMELLKKENVNAILCVLEDFEIKPTLYFKPIIKEDWEKNNISFLQIKIEDSYGAKQEDIITAVNYILDNIRNNKKVYVHCKAGRGRSASIVLGYLLWKLFDETGYVSDEDVMKTYNEIKKIRGEIYLNDAQLKPIFEYVHNLNKIILLD